MHDTMMLVGFVSQVLLSRMHSLSNIRRSKENKSKIAAAKSWQKNHCQLGLHHDRPSP